MAEQKTINDEYPSYYNESENEKVKKKVGCPAGFYETKYGKCLQPEFLKLEKKMKELEEVSDNLKETWGHVENLAKTGGEIPFEGKTRRLNLVHRLVDENIDTLKEIKRYLFW